MAVIKQQRERKLAELHKRLEAIGFKRLGMEIQDKFMRASPEIMEEFQKLVEMGERGKLALDDQGVGRPTASVEKSES